MKKYSRRLFYAIIIGGFLVVLYWVEQSGWSSRAISQYNGGYGTFDMKTYDVHVVDTVLGSMDPEGFEVSYGYYIGDYLLVIFFGLFQYMLSQLIYQSVKSKNKIIDILLDLTISTVIIRGIADIIENTILINALIKYPTINDIMIRIAQVATQVKLKCIIIWVLLVLLGLIIRVMLKCNAIGNSK